FHGLQFIAPEKRDWPTSYYSPDSGIGLLLRHWPSASPRRIGVVGLGVGTLAAYGTENDLMRFYEINPEVVRLARTYFFYLDDSQAEIEIVPGDARLSMAYEPSQQYDVLALDAFSSDAIPVHLLTVEAFEVYLSHLAEGGVLAVHISTQHLDLQAVIWKLAEYFKLTGRWIENYPDDTTGALASDWILLSREGDVLEQEVFRRRQSLPDVDLERAPLWTDDHINLLRILKKKR
ncbi:MAG: fused MFS/spermidine synthase, partial [Planctomycetes bacterium]|nr:fused MFS/spermidine synthase [Planctomycetota bacterium]